MYTSGSSGKTEDLLRQVAPFERLTERNLGRLVQDAEWHEVAQGDTLLREGDPAERLLVVVTGCCSLMHRRAGEQRVLWFGQAPVVVGEQAVLGPPARYPASVVADGACAALALTGERVRKGVASDPAFALALLDESLRRDAELLTHLDVVTTPGAEERVAKYLARRARRAEGEGWRVSVPVSRKHLAHLLALTPETLSRVLKRFRHRGWVANAERGLRIIDRDAVCDAAVCDATQCEGLGAQDQVAEAPNGGAKQDAGKAPRALDLGQCDAERRRANS